MKVLCISSLLLAASIAAPALAEQQLRGKAEAAPAPAAASGAGVAGALKSIDDLLQREGGETAARVAELQLREAEKMRFAHARSQMGSGAGLRQEPAGQLPNAGLYQYGSPFGNGVQDYRTPYYGSFSGNYGPIGSPVGPYGMGSFAPGLDPRGFGAPLANYSVPMIGTHPVWPIPPNPFPLRVPNPYNPWQATPPFSGVQAPGAAGANPAAFFANPLYGNSQQMPNMTYMGPLPFGPYGASGRPNVLGNPFLWGMGGLPVSFSPYGGPAYGGPAYGGPAYGGPAYGGPAYGGPAYGGPAYGFHSPIPTMFPSGAPYAPFAAFAPQAAGVPGIQAVHPHMAGLMPSPNPMAMHPAFGRHPAFNLHGQGAGFPHPDFDRYHSVNSVPPAPAGAAGSGSA